MQRRALNRLALAWALAPWRAAVAAAPDTPAPRWPADPFALGVASGQPRPDGVVLWTRLNPGLEDFLGSVQHQKVIVRYEVYSDEALRQPLRTGQVGTDAARGWSVHVALDGLAPGRPYWYRFVTGDAVSPVGRTRTAPAPDSDPARLRLALASCQHFEHGWFTAHRDLAAQTLDAVLFVGDAIYESSNPLRRVAPGVREHRGGVPHTLAQYRARYAQYRADPDLQACHAAHPWLVTWDDHEVVNDYAGEHDPRGGDPAAFLRRRAAAWRAWLEHMPLRLDGADTAAGQMLRIHHRLPWGRLANLWVLDGRQYRSPQACQDPLRGGGRLVLGCDSLADPARTLLGAQQERWLAEGLAQPAPGWQLVAQSTLIAPAGLDTPLGRARHSDGWDGYPAARQRLLDAFAASRDVVALGGDVHMAVAADLRRRAEDRRTPVVASEFVTPSITSTGMREAVLARIRADNPDIRHARADAHGYTLLDVTPARVEAVFRTTPHPVRVHSVLTEQARFVVLRGRPGVLPA